MRRLLFPIILLCLILLSACDISGPEASEPAAALHEMII